MPVTREEKLAAMKYAKENDHIRVRFNRGGNHMLYGTVAENRAMAWFRKHDLIYCDDRAGFNYDFHVNGLMVDVKHSQHRGKARPSLNANISLQNDKNSSDYYMVYLMQTADDWKTLLEAELMGFANKEVLDEHGTYYERGDIIKNSKIKVVDPVVCIQCENLIPVDRWYGWVR